MAPRQKPRRLVVPVAAPDAPAGQAPAPRDAARARLRSRLLVGLVIGTFVLFQGAILLLFRSGEEIRWKKELSAVDSLFQAGDAKGAVEGLGRFGENWPDAKKTYGWNEKMARYRAAADDWPGAADAYVKAAAIEPAKPGLNARVGEALFKAGRRDEAIEYLARELEKASRATGDHDRANFYLGLSLYEDKRVIEAFQHFQAIADTEKWKPQLADIRARVEKEYLAPAREEASATAAGGGPTGQ